MTTVNCPVCDAVMTHVVPADYRCERCGYEYITDWDKMSLIGAAMYNVSRDAADSFPGFVPHLVDLCSGAYWPSDDEANEFDLIYVAGLYGIASPIDIVVWHAWHSYLSEFSESYLADELGVQVEAA